MPTPERHRHNPTHLATTHRCLQGSGPPGSKTARETQLPGLDEATAASQQRVPRSVEIDESARLAPRTMSSETRSRVDRGQTQPQAPRGQTHPQDASLSLGRICSTPSQTHLPAEGPLFQPSLALNIDPAPVQPLTRPTLPQPPARAPIQSSPANPSPVSSTGPGMSSVAHQGRALQLLKPKEPPLSLVQSRDSSSVARPGKDPESAAETERSTQLTRIGL